MAVNPYYTQIDQTLQPYIPLPIDTFFKAGEAIQGRYDQSVAEDTALQTGIASTEARAPGYKHFVKHTLANYQGDMSNLMEKYGNRLDDPEFRRESKQIINRYKNDPTWQTIKQGNEAIKMDTELAARLRAEGKMVINPSTRFQGLDAQGGVQAYTPGVKQVKTLDDWEDNMKMAWQSMENNNRGQITNKGNLDRARKSIQQAIKNGNPEVRDLIQAYTEQGYTPQQAQEAVINQVDTLGSKYAVRSDRDAGFFSLEFQKSRARVEDARHAATVQQSISSQILGPKFVRDEGSDRELVNKGWLTDRNVSVPRLGKSDITFNKPFKGVVNGDAWVFGKDVGKGGEKASKAYNIKDGTFINASVNYVITSGKNKGQMLSHDESGNWLMGNKGTSDYANPKFDSKTNSWYVGTGRDRVTVQPQAMGVYKDNETDNTIYKKLNRDEAITYLGPQAGRFSNDPQPQVTGNISRMLRANPQSTVDYLRNKVGLNDNAIKKIARGEVDPMIEDKIYETLDTERYMLEKNPLFGKPGTSTPLTDLYPGLK